MRDFSRDSPALSGTGRKRYTSDLGVRKTRIFLQTGLDTISRSEPVGQISEPDASVGDRQISRRCRQRRAARSNSRRLLRLQSQSRLDRFAHQEFLDLAGDRHRKFVDEFDVARNLVVRDLALTEGADFVGRQGFAGARPDPRAQLLAITVVGDAKNLHVLDLGMAIKEFLDLARIKVLAAADHHVLDTADDVAIAFLIDDGDIAGVHPAAGVEHVGGLFGLVPIAQHDAVATGAEFAAFAAGHDAALEIDDLDLDMRMNAPDGRHPP